MKATRGGEGEDQAALAAKQIQANQSSFGVEQRPARRSPAAARPCARSRRRGAGPGARGRDTKPTETKPTVARRPRPPGFASATTGVPIAAPGPGRHPLGSLARPRRHVEDGDAQLAVGSQDPGPCSACPSPNDTVAEPSPACRAAVSTRSAPITTPGTDAPASADADDRTAERLRRRLQMTSRSPPAPRPSQPPS